MERIFKWRDTDWLLNEISWLSKITWFDQPAINTIIVVSISIRILLFVLVHVEVMSSLFFWKNISLKIAFSPSQLFSQFVNVRNRNFNTLPNPSLIINSKNIPSQTMNVCMGRKLVQSMFWRSSMIVCSLLFISIDKPKFICHWNLMHSHTTFIWSYIFSLIPSIWYLVIF